MGYFGHINCSDNFSKAFKKYEVKPRKGWIAINLFFNTSIDQLNVASFDEPWSRPGDYVLFRATKDLICASSACPCDVDAANGWNPTDIFVRTYSKEQKYSKAVAFRMKEDSEPKLTKETGFHKKTSNLTRNFVDYNGYWLANNYTNYGTIKEYTACREKAIAIDLSPLRKFEVVGPDSENLMQYALTRNVKKIAIGQVSYSAMCYENGGMIDDGTIFRLAKDNFRWIGGQEYGGTWLRELAKKKNYKAWVKSSTDQIHNISVQGPNSRKILEKFVWTPPAQPTINELQWFRFTIARIDDHVGIPIIVSRTGYTGELGFEIWCHPNDASKVWEKVFEHGKDLGITPMGLEGLDMVRIEAGLIFYGYEFNDQTDPFEAGIGFAVPLKTKKDDFVGKEALIKRKASPQKKLVGLELIGKEQAVNGDGVHVGRATVGIITSGMISPVLNKNIALCRMDVKYSDIGTNVEIGKLDGHQKRIGAKVIEFPFYDPEQNKSESMTMSLPKKAKYVVIGAGIHGLSTAWHLAEKLKKNGGVKENDIVVIDKTAVAAGASGIACGVVRNNYFQPAMRELMAHSVEWWESDPEKLWSYESVGYLQISPESMRKDVETIYEQQQNIGYESEFIVGEKKCTEYMKKIFSDWQAKDITNILHEKRGGYSKNKVAIKGVAKKAEAAGAKIVTGVEVTGFKRGSNSNAVTGVQTSKGLIECDQVIVGVGPWVEAFGICLS